MINKFQRRQTCFSFVAKLFQDQSIEESNSICKECEAKIENAFDFKSCLVNTLVPSGDKPKIVDKDAPSTSTGESSTEKITCYLCKNLVNTMTVISLPKILKDDSMMEVFQGHIPELVSDYSIKYTIFICC